MDIQALSQPASDTTNNDFGNSIDDVVNSHMDYQPLAPEFEPKPFDAAYPKEEETFLPIPFDNSSASSGKPAPAEELYSTVQQPLSPACYGNTIDAEAALPVGDYIFVFVLLKLPQAVADKVWRRLRTTVIVTLTADHDDPDAPQRACPCEQQFAEMPAPPDTVVREVSVQIPLAAVRAAQTPGSTHLFQMFLQVSEAKDPHALSTIVEGSRPDWSGIDLVSFVHLVATAQPLRPIPCELSRTEAKENPAGIFIGSFSLQGDMLYHHIPNDAMLKSRSDAAGDAEADAHSTGSPSSNGECVVIVDRDDMNPETNGARGGRPSHKHTGELLMTSAQVEKLLEIRGRWEGLSPRQRRDTVTEADFFPFFTINRDETAHYLGVCATWLKDAIRAQGVLMWPGRPLRRSGAYLQNQKEQLESAKAKLQFMSTDHPDHERYRSEIQRLKRDIIENVQQRVEVVKAQVSPKYFAEFVAQDGSKFLNPDWNALPPSKPQRRDENGKPLSPDVKE